MCRALRLPEAPSLSVPDSVQTAGRQGMGCPPSLQTGGCPEEKHMVLCSALSTSVGGFQKNLPGMC